jgi:hypothetical protein
MEVQHSGYNVHTRTSYHPSEEQWRHSKCGYTLLIRLRSSYFTNIFIVRKNEVPGILSHTLLKLYVYIPMYTLSQMSSDEGVMR